MPKVRNIMSHVIVTIATRPRTCRRKNSHAIRAGEPYLVVHTGPTNLRLEYCPECAKEIVARATGRLDEINGRLWNVRNWPVI